MVAKSYENLEKLSEPYKDSSGRMYIEVRMKNGNSKKVRWYSEKEYNKMYGITSTSTSENTYKPKPLCELQNPLGFFKGYINLIIDKEGIDRFYEPYRYERACRYNTLFFWYIASEDEVPEGINTVKVFWDDIKTKSKEEIISYIKGVRKKYV